MSTALASDGPALRAVRRHVLAAWTLARAAFAVEILAAAAFAAACAFAAARASVSGAALFVALLCGAFAGGSIALERVPRQRDFVRELDARAGFAGALATVFAARATSRTTLLLARRVNARLSLRQVLRALTPATLAWLAAPLLGWALVVEARDAEGQRRSDVASAVGDDVLAAARALDAAGAAAGARGVVPADEVRALAELAERARGRARAPSPTAASAALARELGARPSNARLDRELAAAVERLQRALSEGAAGRPGTPTAPSVARRGVDPRGGPGSAPGVTSADESGSGGLAEAGSSGTMSGSAASDVPLEHAPAPPPDASESGVGAARWWPTRYDAIVEHWISARGGAARER